MADKGTHGGRCHIGTSGWSYAHWAKGRFYPRGLKQGEWLRHFADHFTTVEVNSSFYRLPKAEMIARWRDMTPSGFCFAVKLWRRITHEKRLADCEAELADFLAVAKEFGPRRGPLLVQLPPSMRRNTDLLDAFLADCRVSAGRTRWRIAVEFRNTDWLDPSVNEVLDRHGVALCLADMERCPITEPNSVEFVYVRRHGPGGRYRGCYSPDHISRDAEHVRTWLDEGRDVHVYFNNDVEGHALDNARDLQRAVEGL